MLTSLASPRPRGPTPTRSRRPIRPILLIVAATILGSCSPRLSVPAGDEADFFESAAIPYRLLFDGAGDDDPWTAEMLAPDVLLARVPEARPQPSEVVFRFSVPDSDSCRLGPMSDLVYSFADRVIHPVFAEGQTDQCRAPQDGRDVIVAVARDDLPPNGFSIWVGLSDTEPGFEDGASHFAPGELDQPPAGTFPALNFAGELPVGETRIIYSASTHCGLANLYYEIGGYQWRLVDDPGGLDYVPPPWRRLVTSQSIDLRVTRPAEDRMEVAAVGSEHTEAYVPVPESDFEYCD